MAEDRIGGQGGGVCKWRRFDRMFSSFLEEEVERGGYREVGRGEGGWERWKIFLRNWTAVCAENSE